MNNIRTVAIKKINEDAVIPTYGTKYSAGADLYACLKETVSINPGDTYMVHIGISMEIPEGYVGLIFARSGMALKRGLAPSNKVGVIDADYRGEIMVPVFNHSKQVQTIEPGERVAQMVITPFLMAEWNVVSELEDTERGSGGFGSTGKK